MALRSHHRASSVPSSPTTSQFKPSTPARIATTPGRTRTAAGGATGGSSQSQGQQSSSLLQPRVAVVLNVPRPWHPWLFALRLSSILPAVWWGTPSVLRLALRLLELVLDDYATSDGGHVVSSSSATAATRYRRPDDFPLTETLLATIWCFASGYLSFYFTDCLMSRWLMNYTPQATVVRLITINAVNAYSTSILLSIAGGFRDQRLLLPGWIVIATTLTVCYHLVHQKINIRKETSTSVSVFSIASYCSMVILLAHIHTHQPGYPKMPLVSAVERVWDRAHRIGHQIKDSFEHEEL